MFIATLIQAISGLFAGITTGIMATTPIGPTGLESIRCHIVHGFWGGILVGLGSNLADLSYLFFIHFGLTQIPYRNETVDALFWGICGLVLLILGITSFNKKQPSVNFTIEEKTTTPIWYCFLSGFVVTLTNPVTPLIWVGVSGTIMHYWQVNEGNYFYFLLLGIFIGVVIGFPVLNLLVQKGRNLLETTKISVVFSLVGVALIVFGVVFSLRGLLFFI